MGYLSAHNLEYFRAIIDRERRERGLIATIGIFAVLLTLTVFGADRIRRQRNRIKLTEEALRESEQNIPGASGRRATCCRRHRLERQDQFSATTRPYLGYHRMARQKVIRRPASALLATSVQNKMTDGLATLEANGGSRPYVEGSLIIKNGGYR